MMKSLYTFYYNSLYTSKHVPDNDIDNYMSDINCQTLTIEEQKNYDKTQSIECNQTLLNMKVNKSPGQHGLPVEFYK